MQNYCLRNINTCSLSLPSKDRVPFRENGKAGILRVKLLDLLKSMPPAVLFILFLTSLV